MAVHERRVEMSDQRTLDLITGRRAVYKFDRYTLIMLVIGIAAFPIFPPISWLCGIGMFLQLRNKIVEAAVLPCPNCEANFNHAGFFTIALGPNRCQGCGHILSKPRDQ